MRLNNALLVNNRLADHGIERMQLSRLLDVHGFDSNFGWPTETGASAAFDTPPAGYDTRLYCVDWLNYVAALSLLRSLDPTKPLFDTEMHISSATKWRHRIIDDAGARATGLKVLLAVVLGQAGHFMWLWARNRRGGALDAECSGTFSKRCEMQAKWFAHSVLTQPRGFASYARSALLAHTHLPTLSQFAKALLIAPRPEKSVSSRETFDHFVFAYASMVIASVVYKSAKKRMRSAFFLSTSIFSRTLAMNSERTCSSSTLQWGESAGNQWAASLNQATATDNSSIFSCLPSSLLK